MLTGAKKIWAHHSSPAFSALVYFFWIQCKILLIVFKAVNVQPPAYITSIICSLRCTGKDLLHVPRSHLKQNGDRASAVTASRLWNPLLPDIKRASSISAFKSGLKFHFYSLAFSTHQPLICCYMCKSKDLRVYLCSNSVLFSHKY